MSQNQTAITVEESEDRVMLPVLINMLGMGLEIFFGK